MKPMRLSAVVLFAALVFAAHARAEYREVEVKEGGRITGKVSFTGELPEGWTKSFPVPGNSPLCGTAPRKVVFVDVKDGALRGAFVMLEGVKEGKKWPKRKDAAVLDQKDCVFLPSHQVIRSGTPVTVRNSDTGTLHTITVREVTRVSSGRQVHRMLFNLAQPDRGELQKQVTPKSSPYLTVGCELHNFMVAHFVAPEHPYAAVVGADGTFTLDDVPPGSYSLVSWHPKLGWKSQPVTVAPKATAQVSFEFSR